VKKALGMVKQGGGPIQGFKSGGPAMKKEWAKTYQGTGQGTGGGGDAKTRKHFGQRIKEGEGGDKGRRGIGKGAGASLGTLELIVGKGPGGNGGTDGGPRWPKQEVFGDEPRTHTSCDKTQDERSEWGGSGGGKKMKSTYRAGDGEKRTYDGGGLPELGNKTSAQGNHDRRNVGRGGGDKRTTGGGKGVGVFPHVQTVGGGKTHRGGGKRGV